MFAVLHNNHPHRAALLGLHPLYSDSRVTLFSPPPEMRGSRQHDCDAYVGQFYGTVYEFPPWERVGTTSGPERELDFIYDCLKQDRLDILASLDASFLATIYDKRSHELHVISDRYGTVRAFYGEAYGVLHLFPRLHYFRDLGFPLDLDLELATQLLSFRYIASERTILSNTTLVAPGCITTFRAGTAARRRTYWSWQEVLDRDRPASEFRSTPAEINDAAKQMGRSWLAAVDRRLRDSPKVVIPLSGGLDSRAILFAALQCKSSTDILTLTYGYPGSFDFEIAAHVARSTGVKHRALPFGARDAVYSEWEANCFDSDGMMDCVDNFFVSHWRSATDFSGDFALGFMGEALGGAHLAPWMISAGDFGPSDSDYLLALLLLGRWAEIPPWQVAKVLGLRDSEYRDLLRPLARETLGFDGLPSTVVGRCEYFDFHCRQRRFIATATQKAQGRIRFHLPFLDNRFVDFIAQLPLAMRLDSSAYHRMFVHTFSRYIDLPTANYRGKSLREALLPSRSDALRDVIGGVLRGPLKRLRRTIEGRYGPATLVTRKHIDATRQLQPKQEFASALHRAQGFAVAAGLVDEEQLREIWRSHRRDEADYARLLTSVGSLGITYACFMKQTDT